MNSDESLTVNAVNKKILNWTWKTEKTDFFQE